MLEKVITVKRSYADVPDREWALKTPQAINLLKALPVDIADKLTTAFLATEQDISNSLSKEVHTYLVNNSLITSIVTRAPSSAETFEFLYHERRVQDEIDMYFPEGSAAKGIYERLKALQINLPGIIKKEMIRRDMFKDEKFIIFNMGSGPGHDTIGMLKDNQDLKKWVHVYCIDPDEKMLNVGKKKVESLGLSDCFTFVPKKFSEANIKQRAHMILMIGILCPMPKKICISILDGMRNFTDSKGIIVYNTVQERMLIGDPLTDFIMRISGWHMDYKTDEESVEIAKSANWHPFHSFYDSLGFNCMVAARKTIGDN